MLSMPRSYFTFIGADEQDSGDATGTKKSINPTHVVWMKIGLGMEPWNRTVVERRQLKLTEKAEGLSSHRTDQGKNGSRKRFTL